MKYIKLFENIEWDWVEEEKKIYPVISDMIFGQI